jgi:hypothetical protein
MTLAEQIITTLLEAFAALPGRNQSLSIHESCLPDSAAVIAAWALARNLRIHTQILHTDAPYESWRIELTGNNVIVFPNEIGTLETDPAKKSVTAEIKKIRAEAAQRIQAVLEGAKP